MFYVLEGTLRVSLGDEVLELEAGSFVCVPPRHAPHLRQQERSARPARSRRLNCQPAREVCEASGRAS